MSACKRTVVKVLHWWLAELWGGEKMPEKQDDVLQYASDWLDEGRQIALATVVETWGSSPRPSGSQLVIDSESNFEGSVSGGCVEGAVITEAMEVITDRKPRILEFGVTDEMAWEVGLACGGRIQIYVEPLENI
jgi:xanthine/CO dehydrogenase XdhC/CoxF family maturation factor